MYVICAKGKIMMTMILERNEGFRRGGNCDRNYSLIVVSNSLSAPRKAQLAGWLLVRHVWPICPEELSTLKSGCWGHLVKKLFMEWNPPLALL